MSETDDKYVTKQTILQLNKYNRLADQKTSILLSGQLVLIGLYLH